MQIQGSDKSCVGRAKVIEKMKAISFHPDDEQRARKPPAAADGRWPMDELQIPFFASQLLSRITVLRSLSASGQSLLEESILRARGLLTAESVVAAREWPVLLAPPERATFCLPPAEQHLSKVTANSPSSGLVKPTSKQCELPR